MPILTSRGAATAKGFGMTSGVAIPPNPTRTTFPSNGLSSYYWYNYDTNPNYVIPPGWTYTFPANTPLGWYYLVVWNDYYYANSASPTASTTYRTRRVFGLQVVNSYNFAARVATATQLASISGNANFMRLNAAIITNTTRSQQMAFVTPGYTIDAQYIGIGNESNTIMVVPGDTITISVNLQSAYECLANWTHNAFV